MSEQKESYTITIEDEGLTERMRSFSESTGHSIEEITVEALREYFANLDDESKDDEVFNPDPGA